MLKRKTANTMQQISKKIVRGSVGKSPWGCIYEPEISPGIHKWLQNNTDDKRTSN